MTEFVADTDRFPFETIDGETVLIDSQKGHLYLFAGTGPCLWQTFIGGANVDSAVAESTARYGEPAQSATRQFLQELVEAEMLLPAPSPATMSEVRPEVRWPETYEPPVLERYDEISEIISMDPIHEVDSDRGWPRQPDRGE